MSTVPFNRPYATGKEFDYIREALDNMHLSGNGPFTKRCDTWLEDRLSTQRALLTHSCTAALEMAALLLELEPGDEVVMPSFTFPSTANAFVLRGCVPVFVDIHADTLNLDERQLEPAIGPRTRAIVPVHYAGVACDMGHIASIAAAHGLPIVEDAAQGILSTWQGTPLGSLGDLAALSFHETKNLIAGEGGALVINREGPWLDRAEILREKGTNRAAFFKGAVDKYSWVDVGSSLVPSELIAAFLWAQMEEAERILADRRRSWEAYHAAFADLERSGLARRPVIPAECGHNAHLYYLLLAEPNGRDAFIAGLGELGVNAVSHYVPLHSSRAGRRFGRTSGDLPTTTWVSESLVRLPLWVGMSAQSIEQVVASVYGVLEREPAHGRGRRWADSSG